MKLVAAAASRVVAWKSLYVKFSSSTDLPLLTPKIERMLDILCSGDPSAGLSSSK